MQHWQPLDTVLLTNYGDGTAYDIKDVPKGSARIASPLLHIGRWGLCAYRACVTICTTKDLR
jgi:hypothetical protein